jgi:bacterioferritin
MPLRELDVQKTTNLLNFILEHELAGVVRYTHYALMVIGPNRIPIAALEESYQHSTKALLQESLNHELAAVELY